MSFNHWNCLNMYLCSWSLLSNELYMSYFTVIYVLLPWINTTYIIKCVCLINSGLHQIYICFTMYVSCLQSWMSEHLTDSDLQLMFVAAVIYGCTTKWRIARYIQSGLPSNKLPLKANNHRMRALLKLMLESRDQLGKRCVRTWYRELDIMKTCFGMSAVRNYL